MILLYTVVDRPGHHRHAPIWRNRCTYCGHRAAYREGNRIVPPIETRRQPWRIPGEIVMRYRAMRRSTD